MKLFYFSLVVINLSNFFAHAMHGGEPCAIEKVPYMAQFYNHYESEAISSCGAAILSDRWILSAAHCIHSQEQGMFYQTVNVGSNYTLDFADKLYNISKIVKHPEYTAETRWNNDISLIELTEPIVFNDRSQPLSISNKPPKASDVVTLTGYGYDKDEFMEYLQIGHQEVISQKSCREAYEKAPQGVLPMGENVFCVESTVVDAGQGDSGSPIVLDGKIVGVAVEGNEAPLPNIYTNVPYHYNWIMNVTGIEFN